MNEEVVTNTMAQLKMINSDPLYKDDTQTQYTLEELTQIESLIKEAGDNLNLEIFHIDKLCHGKNTMMNVCMEIYIKNDIINGLGTTKECMLRFQSTVQSYYINNYYHNSLHAADVTNTIVWILNCGLREYTSDIEAYAMIIGATVHDVGHPGFNNPFLINMKTTLSLIYNDQSLLENYHCFLTFQILSRQDFNILANYGTEKAAQFRKVLIHVVLDTDLSKHFLIVKALQNSLDQGTFDVKNDVDRMRLQSAALKTADIGHAAKSLPLHKCWSRRVTEEFWNQGDKELANGLAVSDLCNRKNLVPKSQIGFIDFLVQPLNNAVQGCLQKDKFKEYQIGQILKNKAYWKEEQIKEESGQVSLFMDETNSNVESMKITKVDVQNLIFPIS